VACGDDPVKLECGSHGKNITDQNLTEFAKAVDTFQRVYPFFDPTHDVVEGTAELGKA